MGIPLSAPLKPPWFKLKLFVPESLPWDEGCNEEIVVAVDHKPTMTQPTGVLVKDRQGPEVAGVGRGR